MIQAFIPGTPQPQGSKAAFLRGKKVVMIDSNKNLPAWRKLVTQKLEEANASCQPLTGAISLDVMFFMPKPKTNRDYFPIRKPDADKLIRAINDSATDAGVIEDDARVVEIVAYKVWATDDLPVGALVTYSEFLGVSLNT